MVAIKLVEKIANSAYAIRQTYREIFLLRKLSEIEGNIFSVRLVDIILPKEVTQ